MGVPMRPAPYMWTVSPLKPQSIFLLSKVLGEEAPHSGPRALTLLHRRTQCLCPSLFSEISEPTEGFKTPPRPHGKGDSSNMF